ASAEGRPASSPKPEGLGGKGTPHLRLPNRKAWGQGTPPPEGSGVGSRGSPWPNLLLPEAHPVYETEQPRPPDLLDLEWATRVEDLRSGQGVQTSMEIPVLPGGTGEDQTNQR